MNTYRCSLNISSRLTLSRFSAYSHFNCHTGIIISSHSTDCCTVLLKFLFILGETFIVTNLHQSPNTWKKIEWYVCILTKRDSWWKHLLWVEVRNYIYICNSNKVAFWVHDRLVFKAVFPFSLDADGLCLAVCQQNSEKERKNKKENCCMNQQII